MSDSAPNSDPAREAGEASGPIAETATASLPARPPYGSIFLLSAAALASEIAFMRALAVVHWHHFAYMVISVALLGFAASGTIIALAPGWWRARYRQAYGLLALAFPASVVAAILIAQALPFNALELLWDPVQPLWLLVLYVLLALPFLAVAACICLTFLAFPEQSSTTYGADLLGAGAGALVVVALSWLAPPADALRWIALLGLIGAAVGARELRSGPTGWLLPAGLSLALIAAGPLPLIPSDYKGLSQSLTVQGAVRISERTGPLGWLTAVASPTVPFRHAPGLSLNAPATPPEQLAIFSDADAPTMLSKPSTVAGDALAHLDWMGDAAAYELVTGPRVLVLGAGGGTEIWRALRAGARDLTAVELNAQLVDLVEGELAAFSGRPYADARVTLHLGEARGHVARDPHTYDLIQLTLLDAFGASAAGLHGLDEGYLYTVEALRAYLDRLAPGGVLSVSRWLKVPPRDGIKLFATAVEALRENGIERPGDHLVLLRTWNTTNLLVSADALSETGVTRLRSFAAERWFDLAWLPGLERAEANRYNQLAEPWLFDAAARIIAGDEAFFDEYKFQVRPATDDRPHFARFLKWQNVPELLSLRGQGGLPLLEQGYLVLAATFAQVIVIALLLVWLSLGLAPRRRDGDRWRAGYFVAIGLGFMVIEIAWIQKLTLYLNHPLYAVTVVLTGFLVFAGLGSLASARLADRFGARKVVHAAVAGILLLVITALTGLPALLAATIGAPESARISIALLVIAPLAFCLGLPFPLGLALVGSVFTPRAWAVNGAASVAAAVGATLLAVHLGFSAVLLLAVLLYALAGMLVARLPVP